MSLKFPQGLLVILLLFTLVYQKLVLELLSSPLVALCATDCELKVLYIVFTLRNIC